MWGALCGGQCGAGCTSLTSQREPHTMFCSGGGANNLMPCCKGPSVVAAYYLRLTTSYQSLLPWVAAGSGLVTADCRAVCSSKGPALTEAQQHVYLLLQSTSCCLRFVLGALCAAGTSSTRIWRRADFCCGDGWDIRHACVCQSYAACTRRVRWALQV